MHNQNQDGRLLRSGHYLGLKFEEGWFFAHVLETEVVELKPWILLNESDNREPISATTAGSTDDEIVNTAGRQLVEPDDDEKNLLFQLLVGVAPSRVQIFPQFGRDNAPNLNGGAEPGKPQVAFNGYDSPYNNPSEQGEIVTLTAMNDLALQAYNPMTEETEARVSFHVNKIEYAAVEDRSVMKAFLQGQVPFHDHSMGLSVDSEQLGAPGWLNDKFGDLVLTTEEILNFQESPDVSNVTSAATGGGN